MTQFLRHFSTRATNSAPIQSLAGAGSLSTAAHTQFVHCGICRSDLWIGVGTLTTVINGNRVDRSGVLLERCTNPSCENARTHQAKPTSDRPCEHPRLDAAGRE